MMPHARFFVPGDPVPQGSMRAIISHSTGRPIVVQDHPKALREWRQSIAHFARTFHLQADPRPPSVPVEVALTFYLRRPKRHYRTGRNADLLRTGSPKFPAGKPDIDKLTRAVLDALHVDAKVIGDDSQVVRLRAQKRYAEGDALAGVEVYLATAEHIR